MVTCCCCCFSVQIRVFIEGLFSFDQDIPAFKEHLRDFLVQIRVSPRYGPTDFRFYTLTNDMFAICHRIDILWLFVWQEFAGEDNTDLFLEEREQQIVKAQEEKRRVQMSVPGIIGPHDIPEEMQD